MSWLINKGIHIGHSHNLSGQNCQDAVEVCANDKYIIGIVCDGCGGVSEDLKQFGLYGNSEVGANLLANFIVRRLQLILGMGQDLNEHCLRLLFNQVIKEIDRSSYLYNDEFQVLDIQRFWLSTINGFVMNDEVGYFFRCGDGIYQHDDNIVDIDQDNAPHYIAYAAITNPQDNGIDSSFIPTEFDLVKFNPNAINRIMVASDGFNNHSHVKLSYWAKDHNEVLPDNLHGLQWSKTGKFGMKKWLNKMYMRGYFDDDCAIITVEKVINNEDV